MLTRDQFWPIFAFAMEQDGNYGTFLVVSPELAVPKGTALGSLVVEEVTSATGVYVSGATPNQAALLKPGDVISFAGDLKVYMITQVSEADADGYADVVFRPPLEKTPVYGSAITTHNVAFTMAFAEPLHEYALSSPELFTFEVKLVEAC
jgi:pSer/pThr/pTyr-binding forkhead associated (FHA) protein